MATRDRRRFAAMAAVAFLLLSGCGGGRTPAGKPPRPNRLLVAPFAVTPGEIAADRASGARAERLKGAPPRTTEQERVGRYFAQAFQAALVDELRQRGLPAEVGGPPARPTGRLAWVEGEFLSVAADQPEMVGFEADRPDVVVTVGLYAAGISGPLQQIQLALNRGQGSVPTDLLPPALLAAGGGVQELGPEERARLDQGARQAAAIVAREIAPSFRLLGWLPGGLITAPRPLGGSAAAGAGRSP